MIKQRLKSAYTVALFLPLLFGWSAAGAVENPQQLQGQWQQAAAADYRFLFKRITSAALWLPELLAIPVSSESLLQPTNNKALQITYHVSVSAEKLRSLALENLEQNFGPEVGGRYPDLLKFLSWFEAVEAGDRYSLLLVDGRLSLFLNGRAVASLAAESIADKVFSIWLGDNAISKKQQARLLKQWAEKQAYMSRVSANNSEVEQ